MWIKEGEIGIILISSNLSPDYVHNFFCLLNKLLFIHMLKEIVQVNQLWTDIYYQLRYTHQEKITHQSIRIMQVIQKENEVGIRKLLKPFMCPITPHQSILIAY